MTKLAEGGFNKVFKLLMDNDSVVIARIPDPIVGRASRVTASEVATMEFVKTVLKIPVPKVLSWSEDDTNEVEAAYILMEPAKGTQLGEIWQDMEKDAKMTLVEDLVAIQKKFASVTFSCYGSLYFAADAFPGCVKAGITGAVTPETKDYVESRFVVGPSAERSFYEPKQALGSLECGPWPSAHKYLETLVDRERLKLASNSSLPSSESDTARNDRLSLLHKFEAVSPYILPQETRLSRPTIWHWDLRSPNLFVEHGRITSVIDWQDVWIGPLFLQAKRPRLVQYHGAITLRLPDGYEEMEDKDEKARVTQQVEKSILFWCYGEDIKTRNPELHELLILPLARKRKETVKFASEISEGDVTPLRECLIQLMRHWVDLGTGVDCLIDFTEEEIAAHDQEAESWNEIADCWSALHGFVARDGWTSLENYEEAVDLFKRLREEGLKNLDGDELVEFERESRWVVESTSIDGKGSARETRGVE